MKAKPRIVVKKRIFRFDKTKRRARAEVHDLRVLQKFVDFISNLFADKVYKDERTEREFKEHGVLICTPDKKKKTRKFMKSAKADFGQNLCHQSGSR